MRLNDELVSIPSPRFFLFVLCKNWKLDKANYTAKHLHMFQCNKQI